MPIIWTERYANYRARLGRVGDLALNWQKDGYHVSALGVQLKNPIPDLDAAKAAAIRLARKLLADAAAELPEEGSVQTQLRADRAKVEAGFDQVNAQIADIRSTLEAM